MRYIEQKTMKLVLLLLVVATFASCQKSKREIERLNSSKDSIEQVVGQRDEAIIEYLASFNEIQAKLDSVKQIQNVLNVNLQAGGSEMQKNQKDKIINDIAQLNNLIDENKKMVAALRGKLKNSDLKVKELEVMLQNLTRQIEEKDVEISELNSQIERMKFDIGQLNERIGQLAEESSKKSQTIQGHVSELNTAYYCWGTRDELIKNNVIEKAGGFIGLGKTYKMKENFNRDYFVKVDIRDFSDILLMVKKAELLSTHPEGSYHLVQGEKLVERFTIDQPENFWSVSKYLVIVVETK